MLLALYDNMFLYSFEGGGGGVVGLESGPAVVAGGTSAGAL